MALQNQELLGSAVPALTVSTLTKVDVKQSQFTHQAILACCLDYSLARGKLKLFANEEVRNQAVSENV